VLLERSQAQHLAQAWLPLLDPREVSIQLPEPGGDVDDNLRELANYAIHDLHVQEPHFSMLVSGEKRIELRVAKRRFTCIEAQSYFRVQRSSPPQSAMFKILRATHYRCLEDAFAAEGVGNVLPGVTCMSAGIASFQQLYGTQQLEPGLVAFELSSCKAEASAAPARRAPPILHGRAADPADAAHGAAGESMLRVRGAWRYPTETKGFGELTLQPQWDLLAKNPDWCLEATAFCVLGEQSCPLPDEEGLEFILDLGDSKPRWGQVKVCLTVWDEVDSRQLKLGSWNAMAGPEWAQSLLSEGGLFTGVVQILEAWEGSVSEPPKLEFNRSPTWTTTCCQTLLLNGAQNVILGDVCNDMDIAKLHGAGLLGDSRRLVYLATLRAAWLTQAPGLLLECVPGVQSHSFIRESLNILAKLLNLQIKTLVLRLQVGDALRQGRGLPLSLTLGGTPQTNSHSSAPHSRQALTNTCVAAKVSDYHKPAGDEPTWVPDVASLKRQPYDQADPEKNDSAPMMSAEQYYAGFANYEGYKAFFTHFEPMDKDPPISSTESNFGAPSFEPTVKESATILAVSPDGAQIHINKNYGYHFKDSSKFMLRGDFVEAWHRFLIGFASRFKIRDTIPLAAMISQETFLHMFQLKLDRDKTYVWALTAQHRSELLPLARLQASTKASTARSDSRTACDPLDQAVPRSFAAAARTSSRSGTLQDTAIQTSAKIRLRTNCTAYGSFKLFTLMLRRQDFLQECSLEPTKSLEQLQYVLDHLGLWLDPSSMASRCAECNGHRFRLASREEIAASEELHASTLERYSEFWRCCSCRKLYWEGGAWCRSLRALKPSVEVKPQNLVELEASQEVIPAPPPLAPSQRVQELSDSSRETTQPRGLPASSMQTQLQDPARVQSEPMEALPGQVEAYPEPENRQNQPEKQRLVAPLSVNEELVQQQLPLPGPDEKPSEAGERVAGQPDEPESPKPELPAALPPPARKKRAGGAGTPPEPPPKPKEPEPPPLIAKKDGADQNEVASAIDELLNRRQSPIRPLRQSLEEALHARQSLIDADADEEGRLSAFGVKAEEGPRSFGQILAQAWTGNAGRSPSPTAHLLPWPSQEVSHREVPGLRMLGKALAARVRGLLLHLERAVALDPEVSAADLLPQDMITEASDGKLEPNLEASGLGKFPPPLMVAGKVEPYPLSLAVVSSDDE
ncbi:unnamed protein product, partial [Effrenium voratum]